MVSFVILEDRGLWIILLLLWIYFLGLKGRPCARGGRGVLVLYLEIIYVNSGVFNSADFKNDLHFFLG